jgi:hypothetical protein
MSYETGRFTSADPALVHDRDSFGSFVEIVLGDFRLGRGQTEWENPTLGRFLEALADFAEARVVDRGDQETATWRLFAEMMAAATGYE